MAGTWQRNRASSRSQHDRCEATGLEPGLNFQSAILVRDRPDPHPELAVGIGHAHLEARGIDLFEQLPGIALVAECAQLQEKTMAGEGAAGLGQDGLGRSGGFLRRFLGGLILGGLERRK